MTAPILTGRKSYQSSGEVNWVKFIPWSAFAVLTAMALAVLMCLFFEWGFYLLLIVPIAAGGAVAAMVALAVNKGHCRNRLVAVSLGLLTGILLYVGYYYASMVRDVGPAAISHVEWLPRYIYLRLKTDVIHNLGEPDRTDRKADSGRVYENSFVFALELGCILFFTAGAGLRRSRRAYCEKCRDWMKRETTTFKPEIGPGLVEALRINSAQSLAALFTAPQKPGVPHTAVAADYCVNLKEGRSQDCAIYLTVKQVSTPSKGVTLDAFESAKGKVLVRQTLLNADEAPALLSRFSSLEKATGTTAAQTLQNWQVVVKPVEAQAMVEVTPVDPAYAGKVLTTKTKLIGNGFILVLAIGIIGGIALLILGGMNAFPDHPVPGGVPAGIKLLGELGMVIGGLVFLAGFGLLLTRPDFLGTRYIRNLTLRELARRPKPFVDPRGARLRFVHIVPRANWAKLKLDDASDVGLLQVNHQQREILFEGDRELYRIPAAAISSCEIEIFVSGEGTHGATKLFRVVLQANHPSGFWEIPIAERGNSGKFRTKSRSKWAQELQAEIQAVMQDSNSLPK